jgi:hypothetical protein
VGVVAVQADFLLDGLMEELLAFYGMTRKAQFPVLACEPELVLWTLLVFLTPLFRGVTGTAFVFLHIGMYELLVA